MSSEMIATLVDGAIPICVGIYCTLLGFRILGKKPGESQKYDQWYGRFGKHFKWLGPLIALFWVVKTISSIVSG